VSHVFAVTQICVPVHTSGELLGLPPGIPPGVPPAGLLPFAATDALLEYR